ncbi:hypothetical protein [Asanoa siamensis]|uniref:Uncharacterized protein n=1 Tax=Asanoa siamensis TaxID=926357 RepID=A0ABQ4CVR2_9ACTN|nr:hypothetical protein [Asanoa siamensis]GIF75386.1 hypothetical protein Asi02nite_49040 [Asanoa siamensis]
MPDQAPWPPPGGRHRAAGLSGPARRYAVIVLALAVTSSLPVLAAIGPGADSIGTVVAGHDLGATTPFIAPPSPDPVVVIPLRPGVVEQPPPITRLRAPTGLAAPPRQPVRQRTGVPAGRAQKPEARRVRKPEARRVRHPEARVAPRRSAAKPQRVRKGPTRVVRKLELWRRPPASVLCRPGRHGHGHRHWRR